LDNYFVPNYFSKLNTLLLNTINKCLFSTIFIYFFWFDWFINRSINESTDWFNNRSTYISINSLVYLFLYALCKKNYQFADFIQLIYLCRYVFPHSTHECKTDILKLNMKSEFTSKWNSAQNVPGHPPIYSSQWIMDWYIV